MLADVTTVTVRAVVSAEPAPSISRPVSSDVSPVIVMVVKSLSNVPVLFSPVPVVVEVLKPADPRSW